MSSLARAADSVDSVLITADDQGVDPIEMSRLNPKAFSTKKIHRHNSLNETLPELETIAESVQKPLFLPSTIIDGSKLILRLAAQEQFTMDSGCKILLTTPKFKIERAHYWQTTATALEPENTVVIDANMLGNRFIPIPLSHYGIVYTKTGTTHVTVGTMIRRSKVFSRRLPFRACNKFCSLSVADVESKTESDLKAVTEWFLQRQSTSKALGSVDPDKAVQMIRQLSSNPKQNVLFIRGDDSMLRYTLKHDEKVELPSGTLIAWTVGVKFALMNYCCFRRVSSVQGEGTIWIQNIRGVSGKGLRGTGGEGL